MLQKNLEKRRHDQVDQKGQQKKILQCFGNPGVQIIYIGSSRYTPHPSPFCFQPQAVPVWLHVFGFRMSLVKGESGRRTNRGGTGRSCIGVALTLIQRSLLAPFKHLLCMILSPYRFHNFPLPCPFRTKNGNSPASAIFELILFI